MNDNPERYTKVAPDSPDRCQSIAATGNQCEFKKMPNSIHCFQHGGVKDANNQKKANLDMLRLAKYQTRLSELRDHSHLKTLSNEIGVLRILLEEKINSCKDQHDLMIQSQSIGDITNKIHILVMAATKLDIQMNQTLSKIQVENFSTQVVQILSTHIQPETLAIIAEELQKAMEKL